MTGPNTSRWLSSSSWRRPLTTVGAKKYPRSPTRCPPVSTSGVIGHALEHPADVRELIGVVERTVEHVVRRRSDLGVAGLLGERGRELLGDAGGHEHPGGRGAVLPGVEVAGHGDVLGRVGEIRVVEDDDGSLAAELEMDALEVLGGAGRDLKPGAHRAGDRHHARVLWATSERPVSRSPQMTLKTPGGRNSPAISAIIAVDTGVVSDGLSTTQLPAASAGANFQTAIING